MQPDVPDDSEDSEDSEDELIDTALETGRGGRETFREKMTTHIDSIRDFCDGLEYQGPIRGPTLPGHTREGRWTFSETDAELFESRATF